MWTIMMAAMMLPSVSSKVLMYAATIRRSGEGGVMKMTGIFVAGYLVAWTGYSMLASLIQLKLHDAALMSPTMETTNAYIGGGVLIAAGIYQWTPLKDACLTKCRTSMHMLMVEWREGARGAFVMGLRDGMFCVGCCWMLMAIMFVVGVMNLLWIALLAVFVLVEKIAPRGGACGQDRRGTSRRVRALDGWRGGWFVSSRVRLQSSNARETNIISSFQ